MRIDLKTHFRIRNQKEINVSSVFVSIKNKSKEREDKEDIEM